MENILKHKTARKISVILFWIIVWQLLAMLVNNDLLLVTPLQTVYALWGLLGKGFFWKTIGLSLCRIGAGFLLGLAAALWFAWLSKKYPLAEAVLSPVMTLCKAVPIAVFVVLLLIWWGASFLAVAICFVIVLPHIYMNTLEGLKNTDKKLLEMAEVFRLPAGTLFFYIYRPALKPFLSSGLKLSLGLCWKSGVAAEVIGTPAYSIGEQLYMSKIHLDTAGVFAWAVVIVLLSVAFERVILWLADKFWMWEPACGYRAGTKCGRGVTTECSGEGGFQWTGQRNAVFQDNTAGGNRKKYCLMLQDISKSYGEQKILQNLSASYEAGQTYYLTSPSGSGKTTLLGILCGLEKPDTGAVYRKAVESVIEQGSRAVAQECSAAEQEERTLDWMETEAVQSAWSCSMVFQEDRLCEAYSAVRNVEMVTGDRSRAREALLQLLDEEALDKPCCQLSGGMKRRVALARAMESASDCVLLDEPFTGMDAETKARAEGYIRERQQGRILIIATHI